MMPIGTSIKLPPSEGGLRDVWNQLFSSLLSIIARIGRRPRLAEEPTDTIRAVADSIVALAQSGYREEAEEVLFEAQSSYKSARAQFSRDPSLRPEFYVGQLKLIVEIASAIAARRVPHHVYEMLSRSSRAAQVVRRLWTTRDLSLQEIVSATGMKQPNASRLLDQLEEAGLVWCHTEDRERRVSLSPLGEAAAELVSRTVRQRKATVEDRVIASVEAFQDIADSVDAAPSVVRNEISRAIRKAPASSRFELTERAIGQAIRAKQRGPSRETVGRKTVEVRPHKV